MNLRVRAIARGRDESVLVCELIPKPTNPYQYRYKWIAASGRTIANGPIATIK
ncbi:hypothetical protein Ciccas_012759, partial [Cichlidogyrus casuarinus]